MKAALVQLCSSDDPVANLAVTQALIGDAAEQGATFIVTPEVTNCVSTSRKHQMDVLQSEEDDITLKALREQAQVLGVTILIGSLALKTDDADGRFANRSFLIGSNGEIIARYDKIHMFDVDVSDTETYRESAGYRPGTTSVLAEWDDVKIGMTICYDLRFPELFRKLAQSGAQILTIPAAFSPVTGAAHWEPLLRARAIETGCFVLAAAQTGDHMITTGKPRSTYGHSMAIAPWGEVLVDAGISVGVNIFNIEINEVETARRKVPSLTNGRTFDGP